MLINETTINCCKPKRFSTFNGSESSNSQKKKVRYKHYEEMSNEVLQIRSILKAHKDVQESGKMQLFKAMPTITTVLVGTSIALAQPGKLAAKAGAGLGFLALTDAISVGANLITKEVDKNDKNNNDTPAKKALKTVAKTAVAVGVATLAVMGAKNTKTYKKVAGFVSKEAKQIADEINNSKLAQIFEQKASKFVQKHAKGVEIAKKVAPIASLVGCSAVQLGLADSLSEDIKEKARQNFAKGKSIQAAARAHFDSIDAQEI